MAQLPYFAPGFFWTFSNGSHTFLVWAIPPTYDRDTFLLLLWDQLVFSNYLSYVLSASTAPLVSSICIKDAKPFLWWTSHGILPTWCQAPSRGRYSFISCPLQPGFSKWLHSSSFPYLPLHDQLSNPEATSTIAWQLFSLRSPKTHLLLRPMGVSHPWLHLASWAAFNSMNWL